MRAKQRHGTKVGPQEGAAAVEFALLAPLLFLILFAILEFGIAFLHVQSIRTAVREGGRAAAVGSSVTTTRQHTVDASTGSIPSGQQSNVTVSSSESGRCTPNNIGSDVIVRYDTANLPGGGIIIRIPMIPEMTLTPVLSATFRCEV